MYGRQVPNMLADNRLFWILYIYVATYKLIKVGRYLLYSVGNHLRVSSLV